MKKLIPLILFCGFVTVCFSQTRIYKNLVMEGAGIRGFGFTGAIEVIDSLGMLSSVERVGGTSSGAIQATLLALGYTPQEIKNIIADIPLKKFNDGAKFFLGGWKRLKKEYGWFKGDKIQSWIDDLISAKTGSVNTSFAELHAMDRKKGFRDLYITGTDLTNQCSRVFSYENYPTMLIRDAVRISLSIPLYYKAIYIDDSGKVLKKPKDSGHIHLMVDGGLLANYPLFLFDSTKYYSVDPATKNNYFQNPETLGLVIEMPEQIDYSRTKEGNYPMPVRNLSDYIKAVYRTLIDKPSSDIITPSAMHRTIAISNEGISPRVRKLPSSVINKLMESGRVGARNYFNIK